MNIEEEARSYCNNPNLKFSYDNGATTQRFRTSKYDTRISGWIRSYNNRECKVILVGSWNGEIERATFTDSEKGKGLDPIRLKAIDNQIKTQQRVYEAEVKRDQEKLSGKYSNIWKKATKAPSKVFKNNYFKKKNIKSYEKHVRFGSMGTIIIPMRDLKGKLWSLQYINSKGEKRYAKGGKVKGACFEFKATSKIYSPLVYFCEGFATGASIHMALKQRVIVCFTADNMKVVAREFRKLHKHLGVVICGDNDKWKEAEGKGNKGLFAGNEAASMSSGYLVYPEFDEKHESEKPTDFNDLHCLEGVDTVRSVLDDVPKEFGDKIYCWGTVGGKLFLSSKSHPEILEKTTLAKADIDILTDDSGCIEDEYRMPNGKVSYGVMAKDLIEACKNRGGFSYDYVRGPGVWQDHGRIIVHLGDRLLIDGELSELMGNQSEFIYKASRRKKAPQNPLSFEDREMLHSLCCEIKWADSEASMNPGHYLLGAFVVSRICSLLPVRPHVWLTGGAATGKSTIMDNLIYPILGGRDNMLYVSGASTEAGIRQALSHSAMPIVFDEFETGEGGADKRVDNCIELMRMAWRNDGASIVKGSPSGASSSFTVSFNAIVSSIQVRLLGEADRGRFTVLEMGDHGNDKDHWKSLKAKIDKIDGEFSNRFFAHVVNSIPAVMSNYKLLKPLLLDAGLTTRVGDQYGMLLACSASVIFFDGILPKDHAEVWAKALAFDLGREESTSDEQDCLHRLLTTSLCVEADGDGPRREMQIIDILEMMERFGSLHSPTQKNYKTALNSVGLNATVINGVWHLAVVPNAKSLNQRVYQGTKWDKIYYNQLKRLKGAESNRRVRIEGIRKYCLLIPFTAFKETT